MASQSIKAKGPSVSFTLIGCWFVISTSFAYVTACQGRLDPSDKDKLFLQDGNHESYYTIPDNNIQMPTLDAFNSTFPDYVKITRDWAYGRKDCDKDILLPPSQTNSTCPWYYLKNTDPNRYPEVIWEARCTCGACLEFNGFNQTSNQCLPVMYNIRVFRRYSCGYGDYTEVLEPIQTGCMCTKYIQMDSTPILPPQPR